MRLIAGLMKADGGQLRVLRLDVGAEPQAVQDRISYMPQKFGLYEDLTIQENLDLYADLHGVEPGQRKERFARLLEMTDLSRFTGRLAGQLSGGMKQARPGLHPGAFAGPAAAGRTHGRRGSAVTP
ncbi:ATP-binding cassette domain-containing protein [Pseudomonas aeruginosa]|nr:ATP-binding cassette domain-containing protein [Pseudomonas aeruginosa]